MFWKVKIQEVKPLKLYIEETKPLFKYFRSKYPNDYHIIDGDQDIEKIQEDILKIVKNEDFQP